MESRIVLVVLYSTIQFILFFLIKRLRYYSFINISCIYKFFIISLLFFVYADWKIVENSGDEKRKSDTRKELLALAVAIITYIYLSINDK